MDDSLREKLDARAQHQLSHGELKGPVEVLIRMDTGPTRRQQAELQAAGCNMRFAAGNVVSGTVAEPANLAEVARLGFVRQIEVSRPMFAR
jgi:hypothetical protein